MSLPSNRRHSFLSWPGRLAIAAASLAGLLLVAIHVVQMKSVVSLAETAARTLTHLGIVVVVSLAAVALITLIKLISAWVTGLLLGIALSASIVLYLLGLQWIEVAPVLLVILGEGILGALAGLAVQQGLRRPSWLPRILGAVILVVVFGANLYAVYWFASPGADNYLTTIPQQTGDVGLLSAPNPGEHGDYQVEMLFYGSGQNRVRPEYGTETELTTATVDLGKFNLSLPQAQWDYRWEYWGFDLATAPLNARVWYPAEEGTYPLVLIAHANHPMEEFADPGYDYLGELLASRGFIVAAVDQNYLNFSRLGGDFGGAEVPVRAWLLLEHLSLFAKWNEDPATPFYGKVDMNKIALIGHSRGGEAVAAAAVLNRMSLYPDDASISLDYDFSIKSVVSIAPSDSFYRPGGKERILRDVDYLVIHGGHDGDVALFLGSRQYERVQLTDQQDFKASLYIYQANHVNFNSQWQPPDIMFPIGGLLNRKPVLKPQDQRRIAQVYISGFLEASLRDAADHRQMLTDYRTVAHWLPETIYINRYQDGRFRTVADFEEDADITTTTLAGGHIAAEGFSLWREEQLNYRLESLSQLNSVVRLRWDHSERPQIPNYAISVPSVLRESVNREGFLLLSLAQLREQPPLDFTVQLETSDGATAARAVSEFAQIVPPLRVRTTKLGFLEDKFLKPAETLLQTVAIPLSAFAEVYPDFSADRLQTIRLVFNKSAAGEVVLDQIGLQLGEEFLPAKLE